MSLQADVAVPEQLWQVSLDEAQPIEWMDLGYAAYRSTNLPVAEHAFGKAADAGDREAMTDLGVLLQRRGGWRRPRPGTAERRTPATVRR